MAKLLLSDDLWAVVEPLIPAEPPKPRGGRPRIQDRQVLTGILFVLRSGIPWEMLPPEMKCGSGMTCWRRLKAWHEAGVWTALHHTLLDRLGEAGQIDWSRAAIDAQAVSAPGTAKRGLEMSPAPSVPTRRTAVNRAQSAIFPPASAGRGRPARNAARVQAERRQRARLEGLRRTDRCDPASPWPSRSSSQAPGEAARGQGLRLPAVPSGADQAPDQGSDRAPRRRLVGASWPSPVGGRADAGVADRFRRLKVRYERRADIHEAFVRLGCALITWDAVNRFC